MFLYVPLLINKFMAFPQTIESKPNPYVLTNRQNDMSLPSTSSTNGPSQRMLTAVQPKVSLHLLHLVPSQIESTNM